MSPLSSFLIFANPNPEAFSATGSIGGCGNFNQVRPASPGSSTFSSLNFLSISIRFSKFNMELLDSKLVSIG
ncbi:hypothetical protein LEP1GSC012_0637 [Leptospira interrogans serovar Valbuzzi str. Valbuzzi]|nr:hypothetical protein LEP1GSC012_0637 [Leptospira interrogans serovar Valbuzzi str. Valbuzzi]